MIDACIASFYENAGLRLLVPTRMTRVILAWLTHHRRFSLLRSAAEEHSRRIGRRLAVARVSSLRDVEPNAHTNPVAGVVLDLAEPDSEGDRSRTLRALSRFLGECPHIPVAVYCGLLSGSELLQLARLGVVDVVIAGQEDTPTRLRQLIERLLTASALEDFMAPAPENLPPDLRDLLSRILHEAHAPIGVDTVARWAFTTRANLWKRFKRAGLEPPSVWMRYARIYRVLWRIEQTGESIERAALRCGFGSGARFTDACRALVGSPPIALTEVGGKRQLARLVEEKARSKRKIG